MYFNVGGRVWKKPISRIVEMFGVCDQQTFTRMFWSPEPTKKNSTMVVLWCHHTLSTVPLNHWPSCHMTF